MIYLLGVLIISLLGVTFFYCVDLAFPLLEPLVYWFVFVVFGMALFHVNRRRNLFLRTLALVGTLVLQVGLIMLFSLATGNGP